MKWRTAFYGTASRGTVPTGAASPLVDMAIQLQPVWWLGINPVVEIYRFFEHAILSPRHTKTTSQSLQYTIS